MDEFFIVAPWRTEGVPSLVKACYDRMYFSVEDAKAASKRANRKTSSRPFRVHRCVGEVKEEVR